MSQNFTESLLLTPPLRCLTCLAALAMAFTVSQPSSADPDHVRPPSVPVSLQVPAGNKVFREGAAIGTQDYICLPSGWTLFGPQATLFDERDEQIITHFLSPNPLENGTPRVTWQDSRDTSRVWGLAVASVTVQASAIPWLLVKVVGAEDGPAGGDELSKASFVQRLSTIGGVAPSTGCTTSQEVGSRALVPYSADYFFYTAVKRTSSR